MSAATAPPPTASPAAGKPARHERHRPHGQRRVHVVWAILAALSLIVAVISIGTGEYPISPSEVIRTLLGDGTQGTTFIVETLRMPRVICALLVGGALGASGAVFQTLTHNPLGSPDVIGFTWGAATGAVLQIAILGGGAFAVSGSAILGGLVTAFAVYGLSLGHGPTGSRLILIGIGISALLAAVTTFLLARVELGSAQAARIWLTGSLNGRGWEFAVPMLVALAILLPLLALLAKPLTMLELGDDAARALGVEVDKIRPALIVVAVGLCGCATAAVGPVPFVALAAPQLARRLTRATGPGLVAATLMGALLLAGSDLLAQRLLPTGGLPVGVMTGALGGAYLIWLLRNEWRKTS
ncbi:MAG: iron chelate uptake ABC transporter family permease subunit [Solirubrobacteraceae bacterium]|nr:iron chelate uptake ABC transporter family permease subunit [Solirubrobacteraceae bacterium]